MSHCIPTSPPPLVAEPVTNLTEEPQVNPAGEGGRGEMTASYGRNNTFADIAILWAHRTNIHGTVGGAREPSSLLISILGGLAEKGFQA